MPAYPPGFDSGDATPGIYIAVTFGTSAASGGTAPVKVMLYGNMIEADITGAGPSFTLPKGTASLATPVQVFGSDDAASKFGRGSELHLGCKAVFDQWPQATLYATPVAKAGTAATMTLTITGSPTAALSARVWVNGRPSVSASIASGDSVTTIATAICTAILATPDLPVTAQNTAGVITITYKIGGLRGNQVNIRIELSDGAQTLVSSGTTLALTLRGSVHTLSGGTAVGSPGIYRMSGGATQDSLTNALAATLPDRYHREVCANIDTTAIDALASQVDTKSGIGGGQLREQWVAASLDTYANAVTTATGRNKARGQLAWLYNGDALPIEVAAQVCTARLIGDGIAGGRVKGEIQDAAANLNGCTLKSILTQYNAADRPTATQIKGALNNGVTPLAPSSLNPGYARIVMSITTRSIDPNTSQPNYSVRKTKIVTTGDDFADGWAAECATAYASAKLGVDVAGNPPPTIPDVVTPKMVRGHLYRFAKNKEADGKLTNVDAVESSITCIVDPLLSSRLLFAIPPQVIPDFDQAAGEIRPF